MRPPRVTPPSPPTDMPRRPSAAGVILTAAVLCGTAVAGEPTAERIEFFETRIRPALVAHCYECHGPEADPPDGNLRLDLRAGWEIGGDSGPALAPHEAEPGVLMQALRYETSEMPPTGRLPDAVVADFEKWIADGAADPRGGTLDHPAEAAPAKADGWAYTPPLAEPTPPVRDAAWPRTPADAFVLAKIEAAGLSPAADAAPAAAFRRLHFDLSGLPPDPADFAAFVADPTDANWAAAVDRLLASPRFGQTWARHWLDVARYADTNGSDWNATWPDAWRFREYVVDAFNGDRPVDRFLAEQIAGDLMPFESDEQRTRQVVATGFLALGTKMLSERDKEKFAFDVADDQIDTVGRAMLGLTLGCARCHDHKFDPVPTRDYYALAGIFTSTELSEGEIIKFVTDFKRIPLPEDPAATAAREAHGKRTTQLKKVLAAAKRRRDEAALGLGGNAVLVDSSEADLTGDWDHSTYTKPFVGDGYLTDRNAGRGEKFAAFTADLPADGEWEARLFYSPGKNRSSVVPVTVRVGDAEETVTVNQRKPGEIGERAAAVGRFVAAAGERVTVTVSNAGANGYVLADAVAFVPVGSAGEVLLTAADGGADEEVARLERRAEAHAAAAPPPAPTAFAVVDKPADAVGDTAIRVRGEARKPGEVVPRGFLTACGAAEAAIPSGSGRLELADWVTRDGHPLTSRVFVNRVWRHLFGRGIVRSTDNFGALGTPPTHPELLDRLAADFVAGGWRLKPLIRDLVTSRVYRLSSAPPAAVAADPANDLFVRANRRRLTAEALRDATLHLAGMLDETPPGTSPVAGFDRLAVNTASGKPTGPVDTAGATVRSLYLPVIRNELPDGLAVFDFADPETVVGVRPTTNGPAQSLFLLNAPQVRDRAAAAADRFRAGAGTDAEKVRRLYLAALSRPPTAAEMARVTKFLTDAVARTSERQAWADLVHVLICSAEFRFLE